MKKLILYISLSSILLSACGVNNPPTSIDDIPINNGIELIEIDEINENNISSVIITTTTRPIIITTPIATTSVIVSDDNISFEEHFSLNLDERGEPFIAIDGWLIDGWIFMYFNDTFVNFEITPGFQRFVGRDNYVEWFNKKINEMHDREPCCLHGIPNTTRYFINENHNFSGRYLGSGLDLYAFIRDFNITDEQIREIIANPSDDDRNNAHYIEFNEKQIEALISKDTEIIIRAFARDSTVIKGDKVFSLLWFYLVPIRAYEENDIIREDLMGVLEVYKSSAKRNPVGVHPFTLDFLQHKIYEFLNGDICIIELCDYDRDFSMPLAYEHFYEGRYMSNIHFHNLFIEEIEDNAFFRIEKNDIHYSPHWVYYNKHFAYYEAEITPDELIEMLPRYKMLDILTEEAWEALQNKIYSYVDYYNERIN
jgi:hypothetical protein